MTCAKNPLLSAWQQILCSHVYIYVLQICVLQILIYDAINSMATTH